MKKNRIIIAGSRSCPEKDLQLSLKIATVIKNMDYKDIEVVSGTCKGADKFGENFAEQVSVGVKRFPADWSKYGKGGGVIRNREMAEYGTHLILLWDGVSKGSYNMLQLAKEYKLKIRIIKI